MDVKRGGQGTAPPDRVLIRFRLLFFVAVGYGTFQGALPPCRPPLLVSHSLCSLQPFAEEQPHLLSAFPPRRLAFLPVTLGVGLLGTVLLYLGWQLLTYSH